MHLEVQTTSMLVTEVSNVQGETQHVVRRNTPAPLLYIERRSAAVSSVPLTVIGAHPGSSTDTARADDLHCFAEKRLVSPRVIDPVTR